MQTATCMANNNGPWNNQTDRTRGHEYERAFERAPDPGDHVPDPNRDARRSARANGYAPDDAGGFGPSTQGPVAAGEFKEHNGRIIARVRSARS